MAARKNLTPLPSLLQRQTKRQKVQQVNTRTSIAISSSIAMAPLILHNVPDEECYVGDDGVKRPYAMYFKQYDRHPSSSSINLTHG